MDTNDRQYLFESYLHVVNNGVYGNLNVIEVLREDFNRDVMLYDEHYEMMSEISDYQIIAESQIISEAQIDEAFFDTVKNFGKNAISSLTNSWKQAKEQGDKDEMERLSKKITQAKTQRASVQRKASTKTASGAKTKTGTRTAKTPTTTGTKLTKTANTKTISKPSSKGKQKVAVAAGKTVLDAVAKQDPETAKLIKSAKPQEIADGLNDPQVKKEMGEISKQVANTSGDGFMSKLTTWMKNNPVKGTVAVALLGVVTTAAAIGSGGIVPLIGSMVAGAAKGAVVGGIGGGIIGSAKSAISDAVAGNKFDIKKTAKAGLAGAKTGATKGAIVGAAGAMAGKAFQGASQLIKTTQLEDPSSFLTPVKDIPVEDIPVSKMSDSQWLDQYNPNDMNTWKIKPRINSSLGWKMAKDANDSIAASLK